MLAHPLVAGRSCVDCATYLYNEDGTPTTRAGAHLRRPPGMPTPCQTCPKIPVGEPPVRENARELTPRLLRAFRHFQGCQAVGRFPVQEWGEDELLFQNARILAEVGRWYVESGQRRFELALAQSVITASVQAGISRSAGR